MSDTPQNGQKPLLAFRMDKATLDRIEKVAAYNYTKRSAITRVWLLRALDKEERRMVAEIKRDAAEDDDRHSTPSERDDIRG